MNRAIHERPLALALAAGLGLGLTACYSAESRSAPAEGAKEAVGAAPTVPAGTSMTFTVDDQVTADSYRPGDRFTATLSTDATGVGGVIVLPMGTKSHWLVTEALSQGTRSLLAARLEAVQMGEDWYPVQATITQADLGPAGMKPPTGEAAETVKTGTMADSLIATMKQGRPSGPDTTAMTANDMTGKAPAALVAVSSEGRPASIAAGSRIMVRLSDNLALGAAGKMPGAY
jgi:hypothetical protein